MTHFISIPYHSLMSTKWPAMAAAAAISGPTRCVRPPLPWRPSKLRLDVDGAPLARLEDVGVHAQAHRASGDAPVESGLSEDAVESLFLGLHFDLRGAGNHHRVHAVRDLFAPDNVGGEPQVFEARVGA